MEHILRINSVNIGEIMDRIPKDLHCMLMASIISLRGSCQRRKVGCVITDVHYKVLSTGYNGPPSGFPQCGDGICEHINTSKSGENLTSCAAVHAEINALMQCKDISKAEYLFCTTMPCHFCIGAILNTPIRIIHYFDKYTMGFNHDMWLKMDRSFIQYDRKDIAKWIVE